MQMVMDDCKFFRKSIHNAPSYCSALRVLECKDNECSFYKPRLINEADDKGEDKTEA